jgi:hypothetical protein
MIDPKTVMYDEGRRNALALQERASGMTGTEIIAQEENIPAWSSIKNYSKWPVGAPVTDEGQVWTLIIPHNAASYPGVRPSGNRACWGLAHTKDPKKAKPWVASYGVSGLYMMDECCTYPAADGSIHVFRNLYENNEFPPLTLNLEYRWEDLGEVGTV